MEFTKIEKLLWKEAHRQAKIQGKYESLEDYFSMACEHYVRTLKKWEAATEPHTVSFTTYLTQAVRFLFINHGHAQYQKTRIEYSPADYQYFLTEYQPHKSMEAGAEFRSVLGALGADAKAITELVLGKGTELVKFTRTEIREHLKVQGWKPRRIDEAFLELKGVFA